MLVLEFKSNQKNKIIYYLINNLLYFSSLSPPHTHTLTHFKKLSTWTEWDAVKWQWKKWYYNAWGVIRSYISG